MTTVDGRWGLQDVTGTFVVRNTTLSQNGTSLTGDDTALNCRFAVTGSVRAQRGITVTWNRARNDCQALNVPETITFTGEAEEAANGFLGTLDTGVPAQACGLLATELLLIGAAVCHSDVRGQDAAHRWDAFDRARPRPRGRTSRSKPSTTARRC